MEREYMIDDILLYSGIPEEQKAEVKKKIMESSIYNSKSDDLFRLGTMIALLYEPYAKDLDIIIALRDINSKETVDLLSSADNNKDPNENLIDHLIRMTTQIACSKKDDGDKPVPANDFMTIITNVVGAFCGRSPENMESFMTVVDYWKNHFNKKEDGNKESEQ